MNLKIIGLKKLHTAAGMLNFIVSQLSIYPVDHYYSERMSNTKTDEISSVMCDSRGICSIYKFTMTCYV